MKLLGALLIGMGIVIILAMMQSGGGAASAESAVLNYGVLNFLYILFCGIIASSAMIVPGVSGSFILILLGTYWVILQSISKLTSEFFQAGFTNEMITRMLIIASLGIGIVIGILGFSRLMSWALKNYPAVTMFGILGLIFGSFYQLYPGVDFGMNGLGSIISFTAGIFISYKFGKEQ